MKSYFNKLTGSEHLKNPLYAIGFIVMMAVFALAIAKVGIVVGLGLLVLPGIIFYIVYLFSNPRIAIITCLFLAFCGIGIVRYVPAPLGLAIDGLLTLGWLAVLFDKFQKTDWQPIKNGVSLAVFLWFAWLVLEIANPEARSVAAWFFAMRGTGLYLLLTVTLCYMVFNRQIDLELFLKVWMIIAVIGCLWGCRQLYIGLDGAEKSWLAAGNAKTHILHGKLRVFSFYSDAGQFGASQAHTFLVAMIIALGATNFKSRLFYTVCALVTFWGMMMSGTRGALFVPVAGTFGYLVLSKNVKVLALGFVVAGSAFFVLKYTSIGQGISQVARMRTALDPNDASFQVRLENQRKLKTYLASRPLGGGIGSAGYWGLRFSPGTFLAETPTDSWYVQIWAENGIVGLMVHLAMLFYILGTTFFKVWHLKDPVLRQKMMALYAGLLGVAFASYGNKVLGQMPTGFLIYVTIVFLDLSTKFDKEIEKKENKTSLLIK